MDINTAMINESPTLIYERADGVIYAREFGKPERTIVGFDETYQRRYYANTINSVLVMAEQHEDMRELLEKLFVLYNLRKTHE